MPGAKIYPIAPTKTIPLNNAYRDEKIFPPLENPWVTTGPMPLSIMEAL
jgi:hypothetical protein